MIILDSNIIIEILKGNEDITETVRKIETLDLFITYVTVMEVVYGARNKKEREAIIKFLNSFNILYSDEMIDKKAIDYVLRYGLSHNAKLPDVIIAAIAVQNKATLMTLNKKDFIYIPDLKLYDLE